MLGKSYLLSPRHRKKMELDVLFLNIPFSGSLLKPERELTLFLKDIEHKWSQLNMLFIKA